MDADIRMICECQRHAPLKSRWHGVLRLATRGAAVLVGVPFALAALDLPTSAMNLDIEAIRAASSIAAPAQEPLPELPSPPVEVTSEPAKLPVFTTPTVRQLFFERDGKREPLTLDVFREDYFSRHIPYGTIIYREARKNGLAPELVAAIVQTESDFRPRLVSHKSAQGLMQIIPDTARFLGVKNPFDPEQNIAAGTRYYRYLLDRFDNETIALAAYNAGEGNVARFGGIPPFRETRNYVVKVNRRAHRYRQRVHSTYVAALRLRPTDAQ